ncbi:MAG: response regulator [Myxococcota bacterium]
MKDANYNVLSTATPDEAIKIVDSYKDKVDLLLSDVILPGMNGLELSKVLIEKRPNLKVLFMSGYTEEILSQQNLTGGSFNLIQKPFDSTNLKRKIREILDR